MEACKNNAHCIGDQKSAILLGSPKFHDIKARNPNDAFAWFIHKINEPHARIQQVSYHTLTIIGMSFLFTRTGNKFVIWLNLSGNLG